MADSVPSSINIGERLGKPVLSAAPAGVGVEKSLSTELTELNRRSTLLVQAAKSGDAEATQFRIDTTLYREMLRALIRDHGAQMPSDLKMDLVRMSALLSAAADCKTGRYIVCPADLMRQLQTQQVQLDRRISALTTEAASGKK